MVGRVLLGQKSGIYGLYVSKPGQDVLASSDYLMATSLKNLQVVERGIFSVTFGNPGTAISWTPLGFRPRVLIQSAHQLSSLTYTSDNSATAVFQNLQSQLNAQWNAGGSAPTLSSTVYWSVLSVSN